MAKPAPATPSVKQPTKSAPGDRSASSAGGRYQVQLLASRSESEAMGAWRKIKAKNSDVLSGFDGSIARADLGDRGIFYRLRIGPISSEAKARSLCSALAGRNVSCLIIRPGR
ncbi:MAG: SPOR domain-containing protein [Rhodospirillales bacterium]|nr:SPOR domain-containing protein [Rhodospirillales bacterium]